MYYKLTPFFILLSLLVSCSTLDQKSSSSSNSKVEAKADNEHLEAAVLWFQKAAEARALFYQGYNTAKDKLALELKRKHKKRLAVVLDLDETVLDNSPYEAEVVLKEFDFPYAWGKWIDLASAEVLPGAREFLSYAKEKGVEIFYISNRKTQEFDGTYRNLVEKNLPVKKENVLLREGKSGKEGRRQLVAKNYDIVLLLGDNLDDFAEFFEKKSVEERFVVTDKWKEEFGRKWVVFPNPMYGSWLGAVYEENWNRSLAEKREIRLKNLVGNNNIKE